MIHILNGILTETFVRYDRKLLKSVLLFQCTKSTCGFSIHLLKSKEKYL